MYFDTQPTLEQKANADRLTRVQIWESRFSFLRAHYGIRPGSSHYLLGTTGTGKTSVLKAIIGDSVKEYPVAIISTEEDALRYIPGIEISCRGVDISKVKFIYEKNINKEITASPSLYLSWIENMLADSGIKLLFIDNLTTSALYEGNFQSQQSVVKNLTEMSHRTNTALFNVVHTRKEVTDNMHRPIMGEDVRGPATPFIEADFFYVFQRWAIGSSFYPVMTTAKHRGYPDIKKTHVLNFHNGIYTGDKHVEFDDINQIFCQRNVLGKKK